MDLPSFPNEMFTPGANGAVISALVFCAALYLFHKKDPARGTRVDRFHVPLLILSLLLTALFLFPDTVRAKVLIEGLYYDLDGRSFGITAMVTGPENQAIEHASILETVTIGDREYRVTSIGDNAFANCSLLESVTIPSTVTFIGDHAFEVCTQLTSVTIQRGTEALSLGIDVFMDIGTSTVKIEFPAGSAWDFDITPDAGFAKDENSLTLTDRNKRTEEAVLTPYPDTSVTDSSAVLIDDLYYELNDNAKTASVFGPKDETIEHASIPETVTIEGTEYRVTTIGDRAFEYCIELESVNIPATVKSIGVRAFEGCIKLTSVDIPSGVTSIGDHAFVGCQSLTSVDIPSGVTSIGTNTFRSCFSLRSVDIPSGVTSIGESAFEDCSALTSVTIPSGITSIGNFAFKNCGSLRSVTIPSTVTSIGFAAFASCGSLESVTIQRGTEALSLGTNVFYDSRVSAVGIVFPEGPALDFSITEEAGFEKDGNTLTFTNGNNSTGEAVLIPYHVISVTDDPEPAREWHDFFRLGGDFRLPATGFSSLRPSALSKQPGSLRYTPAGMRLMIPSLDVDSELVTVPPDGDTWAVEWLGDRSGILEGSALPGRGFSMVAAHNSLNDLEAGPFALLSLLEPNDVIAVSGKGNELKIFRVFANELVGPDDMETVAAIASREADTLVLITCENESAEGGYLNRRVVFAK